MFRNLIDMCFHLHSNIIDTSFYCWAILFNVVKNTSSGTLKNENVEEILNKRKTTPQRKNLVELLPLIVFNNLDVMYKMMVKNWSVKEHK